MTTKNASTKFNASTPTLSHAQCVDLICEIGDTCSVLVEGESGSGKTAMASEIAARKGLRLVTFDNTTKDVGDWALPKFNSLNGREYVSMVPNEELGLQFNEPIVLFVDELGKNRSMIPMLTRLLLERVVGTEALPRGSMVFGATNLASENMGDLLLPHVRNRLCIVRRRKPNAEEWCAYAAQKGHDPSLIAAIMEFPQMLDSFTDVENPSDNPYIYDPRDPSRVSFVTHRSLSLSDNIIKKRAMFGDEMTRTALAGYVGGKAAGDIMTMVTLGDTVPKFHEIVAAPDKVKVPTAIGARIISAITCVQRVQQSDFSAVFTYVQRLPMETQALFCSALIKNKAKSLWVVNQSRFTEFAFKNFNILN